MTTKCSVFIAASLDGFIARPDGDIEWLHNPAYAAPEAGDMGYGALMANIDALVLGRHSFEKVLSFPAWPYDETNVVVLTSRPLDVPPELDGKITAVSGTPAQVIIQLAKRGWHRLYIDGGITIQRFLQAGLIDEITLTQIPILLGDGIPLFGVLGVERPLTLVRSQAFSNGFVQSTYKVENDAN